MTYDNRLLDQLSVAVAGALVARSYVEYRIARQSDRSDAWYSDSSKAALTLAASCVALFKTAATLAATNAALLAAEEAAAGQAAEQEDDE